jgi:hypothetical protein
MSMQIQAKIYSPPFGQPGHSLLYLEDLRVKNSRRISPSSVKVQPSYVTPKIAVNYSIYINHRKYLHHIIFEQMLGLGTLFKKTSHQT